MKPIQTQAELDAVLSARLKRERSKITRNHVCDLQKVIDSGTDSKTLKALIELQSRWNCMISQDNVNR